MTPKAVSRFINRRSQQGLDAQTLHTHVAGLIIIAQRWCSPSDDDLSLLKRMASHQKEKTPKGMSRRPQERLAALQANDALPDLFRLPCVLLDRAEDARKKRKLLPRNYHDMRVAAALTVLFTVPLRLGNLASLQIGRELSLPDGPRQYGRLSLDAAEVKNDQSVFGLIDPENVRLLKTYLQHYRGKSGTAVVCRHLFPSRCGTQGADRNQLARLIRDTVKREIGLSINVHLFRTIAATVVFTQSDGNEAAVRALLGHRSDTATWRAYTSISQTWAGDKYRAAVAQETARLNPKHSRSRKRRSSVGRRARAMGGFQ